MNDKHGEHNFEQWVQGLVEHERDEGAEDDLVMATDL